MKKISLILTLALVVTLLAGCGSSAGDPDTTVQATIQPLQGEPLPVDTTDMTSYDLACGLSLYGPSGMKEEEIDGLAAYLNNGFFLIMIIQEPREGTLLAEKDLQGYADLLTESNGIPACQMDIYGSLATSYLADAISGDDAFYYYMTVKETADSFWLVQIACPDYMAAKYADSMARWSATITPTAAEE